MDALIKVPQRVSMITLGVADVAASTRFYQSLGWRRSSSSQDAVTFFQMEGSVLGLYGRDALAADAGVPAAGSGFRGVAVALNCASRQEVDAVYARWVACGAAAVKPPEATTWGGYASYVADPDGHLWELAHNPFAPIGDDGRSTFGPPVD